MPTTQTQGMRNREDLLAILERSSASPLAAAQVIQQEDLLADIDDLARKLQRTMENADAWEDQHGWDDYHDDEDSLGPYDKFVETMAELFEQMRQVRSWHTRFYPMLDDLAVSGKPGVLDCSRHSEKILYDNSQPAGRWSSPGSGFRSPGY